MLSKDPTLHENNQVNDTSKYIRKENLFSKNLLKELNTYNQKAPKFYI